MEKEQLKKRTTVFLKPPKHFEIAGCQCGNNDTQWSEFEAHVWCDACQLDFKPTHGGIFDGPIPVKTTHLLGVSFHRLNLETNEVEAFTQEGYYVKAINFFSDMNFSKKKEVIVRHADKSIPIWLDLETCKLSTNKQISKTILPMIICIISCDKEITEWELEVDNSNNQLEIKDNKISEIFKKFVLNQKLEQKYPELKKTKPSKI